jgi:hypothetical protein
MQALQQCSFLPRIVTMLAKSLHRVLQLAPEPTIKSLRTLDATSIITHVMEQQKKVLKRTESSKLLNYRFNDLLFFLAGMFVEYITRVT